jgi:hypothetical protein
MGLLSKFGIGGVTTLLARNIVINENPANGENYLLVEGDEVGFLNWLLKILGLKDPSVKFSINDNYITTVNGGKLFTVSPTSQIYGFSSGFSKDKNLLILAILFIWTIILPIIFYFLYTRSGAMVVTVNCFKDGVGQSIRVKEGLTGKKLDKSDFEGVYNAIKNVSATNSTFYKK